MNNLPVNPNVIGPQQNNQALVPQNNNLAQPQAADLHRWLSKLPIIVVALSTYSGIKLINYGITYGEPDLFLSGVRRILVHSIGFGLLAFVLENRRMGNPINNFHELGHALFQVAKEHAPVFFIVLAALFGIRGMKY